MALVVFVLIAPATWAQETRSGGEAFAIEAAGASGGSLIGAVAAHQLMIASRGACDVEDLSCLLGRLGVIGAASIAGAAGGGFLTGRAAHTDPSLGGSILGAVLGVAAGVAATSGLEEAGASARWTTALGYSIAQGLVTAAGSRLLAR